MGFTKPTEETIHLDIDGKGFELIFDFEAVARAEDLTGRAILTGLNRSTVDAPSINFVRAMLYACLLKHQPKTTYDEARALVNRDNLAVIWQAVVEAYIATCVIPNDEQDEQTQADENPIQAGN